MSANKCLERKIQTTTLKMLKKKKQLVHGSACVQRDMKHAGSLESAQKARDALGTLTHLSCFTNFPRASYLDGLKLELKLYRLSHACVTYMYVWIKDLANKTFPTPLTFS